MNTRQPVIQSLSPIARQVAECYAVVYPQSIARTKAKEWLNSVRKATAGKKGLTSVQVSDAIAELVEAGILEPGVKGGNGIRTRGPRARHGYLTRLCEDAEERGVYDMLIEELESTVYYSYHPLGHIPQELVEPFARHALITNTFDEFPIDVIRPEMWLWLTESEAKPYLQKIPSLYRADVCTICLSVMVHRLQPFSEFAKTADEVNPGGQHQVATARGLIFQGQLKEAQSLIVNLQEKHSDDKPVRVECQSMLGLICVLTGDDKTAMQHIETTLALEGSGTKKRILYPDSISFSLSLFALARIATLESRSLLDNLLQARKKLKIESELDWPLQLAAQAQRPHTDFHPSLPPGTPDLDTAIHAIASRWHTDYHHPTGHSAVYQLLTNLWKQASTASYAWIVAETQTVMEANTDGGKQSKLLIKKEFGSVSAKERHEALGTTSLTHLVKALEPWEFSLQALEQLALKAKPVKARQKQGSVTTSRRLIWQINDLYDGHVEVVPMEQTMGKSGKWSGGRKVALKRLKDNASTMDHLIPQDKKACASIQKGVYGWDRTTVYETDYRTIYQLTGHPHVYDEHGELIDVVEQPPALTVTDSNKQLQLRVAPTFIGTHYRVQLDYQNHRAYVTHFNASHRRIAEAVQQEGLLLPLQAKQRLQAVLDAMAGEMAVQGDQQLTTAEMQEGVAEPLLEMEPAGHSLRVRLRVEPLPDSGRYFDVATGGAVVYIKTASGSVPVNRNLQREREKLDELLLHSQVLSEHYDGRNFFVMQHPLDALELLEDAQANNTRCLWPDDMPFRITARADLAQVSLAFKKAKDWFSASGSLDISDDTDPMSIAQLLRLMQAQPNSRFIELGKGEFLALSHKLKQQLDSLQAFSRPEKKETTDNHLHPMALLALEPLLDAATVKSDKAWKQHRKQIQNALETTAPVPANLQAELRSYQLEGYNWLEQLGQIGAGACLADDMGLGKTVQTLALLLTRAEGGPALVVAPTSVVGNWLQESQRFAPSLNAVAYGESSQSRSEVLSDATSFDLIIISYGLIVRDIEALEKVHWHTVVLDEAQAIKNAATQRAKCVKQLKADFRVVTTGTPVQNNLMDLHSLFGFLNPQLLGSAASFRQRFALPITRDNNNHAREQLQQLIAPFLLRRHKRDVLKELPERTELTLKVQMSPEETALYEMIRKEALESLGTQGKKKKGNKSTSPNSAQQKMIILSYLTKLRRLCCHPSLIAPDWTGPESKLEEFSETLNELISSGHRALVFSQFVDHLRIVEKRLKKQNISYQYLDGSTAAKQRTKRVSDFQAGEGQVFLISLNAGGAGLNLTAADYVIHLDPWWNPAVEDQASDRAHRIGQQRPVTIVRMVTTGTIEEQIQELHTTKRELADSVLAGADSPSLNMDTMMKLLRGQDFSQ